MLVWWYVVVCGGMWWYVVVCGGMWWYVVVCGGMWWYVVAHVRRTVSRLQYITIGKQTVRGYAAINFHW